MGVVQVATNLWEDANCRFDFKVVSAAEVQPAVANWMKCEGQNVVVLSCGKLSREDLSSAWCALGAICCCLKVRYRFDRYILDACGLSFLGNVNH